MSGRAVPAALGTVALFAIVAAAAYFLLGGGGGSASPEVEEAVVVPPMTAPLQSSAELLPLERIRVSTSSAATEGAQALLVDGDASTLWVSGTTNTAAATNETLVFRFTEPVVIESVRFTTGQDSSDPAYQANHRVKTVQVTTDTDSQPVNLLDTGAEQEIEYRFGHTSKVVLEVLEIYPSESSADAGIALAEIGFIARVPS
jgi:hypothetical protein